MVSCEFVFAWPFTETVAIATLLRFARMVRITRIMKVFRVSADWLPSLDDVRNEDNVLPLSNRLHQFYLLNNCY